MAEANVRLRVDGRDAVNQLNRVNKAAGTLQGTVGKLVGAFAGIQAAKFVFFKTAELETQTRSLKVLTGSLGNAQKIIKELQQFGAVTPFTSSELIETAKRLKAFGFETNKIVDVTKRLGDIAGATGADLGGIATAFGQIQAKGRLQGEELLQLQERGVDLQGTLRKEYGLTAEEFQKALSKGQIGADAVSFALEKLTEKGGKYAGGAISQSDTLNGKLSTLTDNIDGIARTLGEVLTPALKDVFDLAIRTTNAINEAFAARSITTKEKQGFQREAVREVQAAGGGFGVGNVVVRHLGKTYQGPPDQVISQITNDLINKEVQKRAGSKALAASTANAAVIVTERPRLGTGSTTGGGKKGMTAEEKAAQKTLDLKKKMAAEAERQRVSVGEIIAERQRDNQLLQVQVDKGKEFADFTKRVRDLVLQGVPFSEAFELESANQKLQDQIDKQQELQRQTDKLNQFYNNVSQTIQSGIVDGIMAAIDGTKSLQESLSGILKSVGRMFLNQAIGSIMPTFAEGGFVSGATNAVVGEAGPEYVIPESKMRESMARYARGARGSAVIPENGEGGTNSAGGGVAVAAPIDVRFNVERINNVDYVTAEQFQVGLQRAAQQGAAEGERRAMGSLRNSAAVRRRIGV